MRVIKEDQIMGGLGIFALIVLLTIIATILGAIVWLAILPGKVARRRGHPQAEAINVAGWLGIFTGIVWIVALIWAYTVADNMNPASADGGAS
jgi:uncharacterized BrkB/YihY/UPF0761 family membrane protein